MFGRTLRLHDPQEQLEYFWTERKLLVALLLVPQYQLTLLLLGRLKTEHIHLQVTYKMCGLLKVLLVTPLTSHPHPQRFRFIKD